MYALLESFVFVNISSHLLRIHNIKAHLSPDSEGQKHKIILTANDVIGQTLGQKGSVSNMEPSSCHGIFMAMTG